MTIPRLTRRSLHAHTSHQKVLSGAQIQSLLAPRDTRSMEHQHQIAHKEPCSKLVISMSSHKGSWLVIRITSPLWMKSTCLKRQDHMCSVGGGTASQQIRSGQVVPTLKLWM